MEVLYCHSDFESCIDFGSITQGVHKIEINDAEKLVFNFPNVSPAFIKGNDIQLHMKQEEMPFPIHFL
jgi:hypothetical protein